jgi:hypothetical protein
MVVDEHYLAPAWLPTQAVASSICADMSASARRPPPPTSPVAARGQLAVAVVVAVSSRQRLPL